MIIGKPITIHLSENEADILQKALGDFQGPYGRAFDVSSADVRDAARHNSQRVIASQMQSQIQDELIRRYEADKKDEREHHV